MRTLLFSLSIFFLSGFISPEKKHLKNNSHDWVSRLDLNKWNFIYSGRYVNMIDSITVDSTVDVGAQINTVISNNPDKTSFDFTQFGGAAILVNTSVVVNKSIQFIGAFATFKTTANITMFDFTGQYITFSNLNFRGEGKSSGKTSQFGIRTLNGRNNIKNCTFYGIGGEAIRIQFSAAPSHGVMIAEPIVEQCNIGINTLPNFAGEYVNVIGGRFEKNKTSIRLGAGNFIVDGAHIDYSDTAISMLASANDGHGLISNNSLNHNIRAFSATGILLGMLLDGNDIYDGEIRIVNSKGIVIRGGFMRDVVVNLDNCSGTIANNRIDTYVTPPFEAPFTVNWTNPSTTFFSFNNNTELVGNTPASMLRTQADTLTELDNDIQVNGTFPLTFPPAYKKFDKYTMVTNVGSGSVTLIITVIINGTSTVNPTLAPGEFMVIHSDHDTYRCTYKTQTASEGLDKVIIN